MKLIHNAKAIALRSHSMWAQYLAGVVLLAPEAHYWVMGYDVASPALWWFLGLFLVFYGIIGRIKDQGLTK
jgi:lysozyme